MALKEIGAREQKLSQGFKDIAIAFGKNPFTDDVNAVKNDNSIKQSVRNLILTDWKMYGYNLLMIVIN